MCAQQKNLALSPFSFHMSSLMFKSGTYKYTENLLLSNLHTEDVQIIFISRRNYFFLLGAGSLESLDVGGGPCLCNNTRDT